MSTRKPHPRNRALRPVAEDLEDRRLLSATVTGTDIDGDQWTLRLIGPGSLTVTKQVDSSGKPTALTAASEIDTITIGGTDPTQSRLVGTVKKGPNGDGKVFFQTLRELPNRSESIAGEGDGPLAIDMPNFWLGNTTAITSTTTTAPTAPSITIPDGVDTLDFGGVDTTHDRATTPPSAITSDNATVMLGLPLYGGTRIVIDKSISSTETVPPATGSPTSTPTTVQHAVTFAVSGRLDLFQANSIVGDATNPPGQFSDQNTGASGFGGTWVVSGTAGTAPFLSPATLVGAVTGQIGTVRVGGDATNFSTLVFDSTGSGGAKISNFTVGGETKNVLLVAPNGSRDIYFGKGMDTVDLFSHVINTLQANRGALNSRVVSDRSISRLQFGGDVVGTTVLSGYNQSFSSIIGAVTGQSSVSTFSPTPQPAPAPQNLVAQIGGGMTVLAAGDVTDSVFAASVQPMSTTDSSGNTTNTFGTTQDLVEPGGHISAKVEGTVNNTNATPDSPTKAFYAQRVDLAHGPVTPPNVPEAPYPKNSGRVRLPGVHGRGAAGAARTSSVVGAQGVQAQGVQAQRVHALSVGAKTPKGPSKKSSGY